MLDGNVTVLLIKVNLSVGQLMWMLDGNMTLLLIKVNLSVGLRKYMNNRK